MVLLLNMASTPSTPSTPFFPFLVFNNKFGDEHGNLQRLLAAMEKALLAGRPLFLMCSKHIKERNIYSVIRRFLKGEYGVRFEVEVTNRRGNEVPYSLTDLMSTPQRVDTLRFLAKQQRPRSWAYAVYELLVSKTTQPPCPVQSKKPPRKSCNRPGSHV
jgi:hypothetical protein